MKVVIVGGSAGGASAAARLRRLDEQAEIIILERGAYVSYANCGLPYYIGGVITDKADLSVQTPESLNIRLALDVRTYQEVLSIDSAAKKLQVKNLKDGSIYDMEYDKLILSPGASPFVPPINGIDDPRVFTLRDIPDTYSIRNFIDERKPKTVLVVGAGYIGLEIAENLANAGLTVTVAELSDHVIAPLDPDMAAAVEDYLEDKGIRLLLNSGISDITPKSSCLTVTLANRELDTDMLFLGIGVRPETSLAKAAGLAVNQRSAIVVDSHMRSSNPDIYAVGDAVEVTQIVTGEKSYLPLAGPANRQGRLAADNIMGIDHSYAGSQGTAIVKLFDMTVGSTGLNETAAKKAGLDYDKIYFSGLSHAAYYPGATPMTIKVLFQRDNGRILGAQIAGYEGVDKRLDVLSVAIGHGFNHQDLVDLELAYAPPYSSAKDPVNMVGFMIQNLIEGRVRQFHWDEVSKLLNSGAQLVDTRTHLEYEEGHIKGAINLPVDELRSLIDRLDPSRPVYIYCQGGLRSYLASRILEGRGFKDVRHLAGGYGFYSIAVKKQVQNSEKH